MKLYDFECGTCGTKFERMVEAVVMTLPCPARACAGSAVRQLGGHPAFVSSPRKHYRGPPLPIALRHVADADDGAVMEALGPQEVIDALEPGMEVNVAVHTHNENGCTTAMASATVIGERGEDA